MDQTFLRRPDSAPNLNTEPNVTITAESAITDIDLSTDIDDDNMPSYWHEGDREAADGEYLIEAGGRLCYMSFHNPAGRTTDEYIGNIIKQKHFSVLEHANVSICIQGVSRALTHELIRHRHFSFSQLSQRYVDGATQEYVAPPLVAQDASLFIQWANIIDNQHLDWLEFQKVIDARYPSLSTKERREAARSIAPNAAETKILVTGNLRAWREFLEKRWTSHAEAEIRNVAGRVHQLLNERYPTVFGDVVYS